MIKRFLIKMIKAYQRMPISSHGQCKYIPSCSNYAIDAIEYYGAFKGTFMAIYRVLRCNPFSKGGYDPVKREETN